MIENIVLCIFATVMYWEMCRLFAAYDHKCLSRNNCFIFAVCDGENVRILASELDYDTENAKHKLQDINVCEAFLSVAELKEIISGLENFSYH